MFTTKRLNVLLDHMHASEKVGPLKNIKAKITIIRHGQTVYNAPKPRCTF